MKNITTQQIKAARMLLMWDQVELARRADIGVATLRRIEAIPGPALASAEIMEKLTSAITAAGVQFLDGSRGIGVRLIQ